MKLFYTVLISIILNGYSIAFYAQNAIEPSSLETESLPKQFDFVISKSSSYEDYKVVKINYLNTLKSNVKDTLKRIRLDLQSSENKLFVMNQNNDSLNVALKKLKNELHTTVESKNSMLFFGMEMSKSSYNLLMWGIVLVLLAGCILLAILIQRHAILTKEAKEKCDELELNFENHRKTALRREQKLARDLMDLKVKHNL